MTYKEIYEKAVSSLAGIDSPEVDAFYLLEEAAHIDRNFYILNKSMVCPEDARAVYEAYIKRRAAGEPYQYIVGKAYFAGYTFAVNPDVLIPRLDTEVLLEEVHGAMNGESDVLDMCTGSGILAICAKMKTEGKVTAVDISPAALDVAAANALSLDQEVEFILSDLFAEVSEGRRYDIIVSNPPYVTEGEYKELSAEVKDHEPKLALTAGDDGLDIYKRLIPESVKYLKDSGMLMLEIGCFQAETVSDILSAEGFTDIKVIKDLAGLDRVVTGRKNKQVITCLTN